MRKPGTLISLFLLASAAWSQGDLTRQENLVKMLYARITFLSQIGPVGNAALAWQQNKPIDQATLDQQLKDAEITFQLSNFRSGTYQELLQRKWSELVTIPLPPLKTLQISGEGMNYQAEDKSAGGWEGLKASWTPYSEDDAPSAEYLNTIETSTVGELINLYHDDFISSTNNYTSYISYDVAVWFGGQMSTYKALCLIGRSQNNEEVVQLEDTITPVSGGFDASMHQQEYPTGLTRTPLRESPQARQFLAVHTVEEGACATGKDQLCYSLVSGKYGIAAEDLKRDLAAPLRPRPDFGQSLTQPRAEK